MAFLDNLEINYADPFFVKNISFIFDSYLSSSNFSISATQFGLDPSIDLVSGQIRQESINLIWQVQSPIRKNFISGYVSDDAFSGFLINFYDKNRNLFYQDPINSKVAQYTKKTSDLLSIFSRISGESNLNLFNEFFIDVVSVNTSGLTSTGIALVTYPSSSIDIVSIDVNSDVYVSLDFTDKNSIKDIDVFVSQNSDFYASSGEFLYTNKLIFPSIESVYIPDLINLTNLNNNALVDNAVRQPYYIHLLPSNYFSTGSIFTSSGIKPSSYDSQYLPEKFINLSGYVYYDFNEKSKDLNLNAFIRWGSLLQSQDCNFHILVEESGKNKSKYDYFLNNRSVENIISIINGTGTGINASGTVFSNYGSSGIQWTDHTIYVDNFGSFPTGIYPSYPGGLKYITEIRIPSGVADSNEIFLSYNYTGGNSFNFLPSGGHYDGTIYTGTYSDSRYLTNSLINNTGFIDLGEFNTGILIAKRITGFADFTYSTIDPSFVFPVTQDNNYFVKVRAINADEVVSEFSDPIYISSGYIDHVIDLSPLSGKSVIDGSGVSGYIPKFSDSDTLTTGTLYYSGSNNLVFTELPTTTNSENLYKLVIEDNIIKKQIDAGNGTSLIDEFTQASHGFVVGDVIRFDGTTWYKAQADSAEHAEVQGVVRNIVDANTFKLVTDGLIEGLSGLTPGSVYFLSETTAGAVSTTEPSNFGEVSKPVYFALTSTSANVLTFRGVIIEPQSGTSGTSGTS